MGWEEAAPQSGYGAVSEKRSPGRATRAREIKEYNWLAVLGRGVPEVYGKPMESEGTGLPSSMVKRGLLTLLYYV